MVSTRPIMYYVYMYSDLYCKYNFGVSLNSGVIAYLEAVVTPVTLVPRETRGVNDLDEAFIDIDCGTVKSSSQMGEFSP